MGMCFVPDCRHYSLRDRCRFYRFPSKEHEKNRWEQLISRMDKRPSRYSVVCSCHFVNGLKSNGPTIFMSFSSVKEPSTTTPNKRKTVHAKKISESESMLESTVPSTSKHKTPPTTHEEIDSPCSSPKSLSSISEILETQLYYFEDEMNFLSDEENRPNTARHEPKIARFDITCPPKPPALSIVVQNGKHYIVDNSTAPPTPVVRPVKPPKEKSPCVKLLQKPQLNRPLLPKEPQTQTPENPLPMPVQLFSVIDVDLPSIQMPNDSVPSFKVEPVPSTEKPYLKTDTLPKVPPITNALLEAQLYFLEEDVKKLRTENEYLKSRFCYGSIADSDEMVILYTGLPSAEVFQLLLSYCLMFDFNYYYDWKVEKIKMEDQLLMTLMKLRRNEPYLDLRVRFNCSMAMVANIILTWLHLLHEVLFLGLMRNVPSQLKNRACLPSCFSEFTGCRMVVDFTEVRCADSKQKFKNNHLTHSHFKHGRVMKGLVGVAPNGVVTFCSKLYPGSASNEELIKDSGLLEVLQEGDAILSDRGFPISDLLPPRVVLNSLPFLSSPEPRPDQVWQARSVARTKIHFERSICRIKGFAVLDLIPQTLRPYACQVWQVCAALTNLQHPLIKEIESFY